MSSRSYLDFVVFSRQSRIRKHTKHKTTAIPWTTVLPLQHNASFTMCSLNQCLNRCHSKWCLHCSLTRPSMRHDHKQATIVKHSSHPVSPWFQSQSNKQRSRPDQALSMLLVGVKVILLVSLHGGWHGAPYRLVQGYLCMQKPDRKYLCYTISCYLTNYTGRSLGGGIQLHQYCSIVNTPLLRDAWFAKDKWWSGGGVQRMLGMCFRYPLGKRTRWLLACFSLRGRWVGRLNLRVIPN